VSERVFGRLAVYCASSNLTLDRYGDAAYAVGKRLAELGIGVVYGGGRVGLMGRVADGALDHGGEVIGVIPRKLQALELGHHGCTRLEVVDTMHERKLRMAELADGFIALPGGWGTWEELFEVVTWTQLGYHHKPVGVLNVHGYYDPLLAMVEHAIGEGFVRPMLRGLLCHDRDLDGLIEAMRVAELPAIEKWLEGP
jgi:uncharacterized protein (TIGR00730 family)